jgi:hypothetical protein
MAIVFVIHNNLLVLRPAIGLLYMAKWFHPALFADIDPSAVHEQLIQQFFNITLDESTPTQPPQLYQQRVPAHLFK